MEISISTGLYYTKSYIEIFDIIEESGCKNIELFLNQAFIDVPVEMILKEVRKRDLNVVSIHLPLTFIAYNRGENEEFWINKGLEYTEVLGVDTIISHFFYKKDGEGNNDESHFNNIVKYTKRSGKNICTENLPQIELFTKLQSTEELIRFLAKNECYMTYDTTHAATHGKDILSEYNIYKDYIRNIHLSDFRDGNEHKVLGTGDLPLKELLKKLKEDKYKYLITLEFDFENPDRNKVLSNGEAVELLKGSLKYVEDVLK